jgi:hypothetical protein
MNWLIPARNLERKSLSDFAEYSEDLATAKAFERPYRLRIVAVVVGAFGGWPILAGLAFARGEAYATRFAPWLIVLPFTASVALALYHVATLARRRPVSLKSGKQMVAYLRTDNPPGIYKQFIYVCPESRSYFTRTYAAAGPQ